MEGLKLKFLWLAVTADKYEFPIFIEDTAQKLAEKLGITNSTVVASVTRNKSGKNKGRKIIKVVIDED